MKILKFYSDTCMPCKAMQSFLDNEGISTTAVNIATDSELVEKYGVMNVPTLILIDDEGNEKDRLVGFNSLLIGKVRVWQKS